MSVLNKYHYHGSIPIGSINIMRGSDFGNPFIIGVDGDRNTVVDKYRAWLWELIKSDKDFANLVRNLNGRDLCCCCAPKPCHGDVLERAAKWLSDRE